MTVLQLLSAYEGNVYQVYINFLDTKDYEPMVLHSKEYCMFILGNELVFSFDVSLSLNLKSAIFRITIER